MRRRFRRAALPMPAGCPGWCTVDHGLDLDVEVDGIRLHARRISAEIDLVATDDLEAGTRSAPELTVRAVDLASAASARRLALAILEGSDLLEDAQ